MQYGDEEQISYGDQEEEYNQDQQYEQNQVEDLVSFPISGHKDVKPETYDDIDQMKLQFDNILKSFNQKKTEIYEIE